MSYQFSPGWTYRPDDIAATVERLVVAGYAADPTSFRGAWKQSLSFLGVTSFLACTVEPDKPAAYCQSTGTCTSMIYRSLQDALNWDRAKFGGISRPVKLCFENIFAGSRIAVGMGGLGTQDGSIGAWVAEFIARYGTLERGMYLGTDLARPREDLAQYWGRPGIGVPTQIQVLGRTHRFLAHKCADTDELADALASGCFGGICRSHYAHTIDRDGFAVFDCYGGHHTCLRGVFVDRRTNSRVFVEQQTHGSGVPDPHPVAHTTDGDIELSDGAYLVRENDIDRFMPSGEVWVFQPIQGEEFR